MMDAYRQAATAHECEGCVKRDAEIRRLKGLDTSIHPCPFTAEVSENPDQKHGVNCPRCTVFSGMFRSRSQFVNDGTYSDGRARLKTVLVYDTLIHIGERYGFLWLRKCVQVPHRHRECYNCGHTWIEYARPVGWEEQLKQAQQLRIKLAAEELARKRALHEAVQRSHEPTQLRAVPSAGKKGAG